MATAHVAPHGMLKNMSIKWTPFDGQWAVRLYNEPAHQPGDVVTVTKSNGEKKDVTLAVCVFTESKTEIWTVRETKPVFRGGFAGRGVRVPRSRGEQASVASQMAPYELAEPSGATGQRIEPEDAVIETTLVGAEPPPADEPDGGWARLVAQSYVSRLDHVGGAS